MTEWTQIKRGIQTPNQRSRRRRSHVLDVTVVILGIWCVSSTHVFGKIQQTGGQAVGVGIMPITVLGLSDISLRFELENSSRNEKIYSRSVTYSLTTNEKHVSLAAELKESLPEGVHLTITANPALGTGLGAKELSVLQAPTELVSQIGPGLENNRLLRYDLVIDSTFELDHRYETHVTISLCGADDTHCSAIDQTLVVETVGSTTTSSF